MDTLMRTFIRTNISRDSNHMNMHAYDCMAICVCIYAYGMRELKHI